MPNRPVSSRYYGNDGATFIRVEGGVPRISRSEREAVEREMQRDLAESLAREAQVRRPPTLATQAPVVAQENRPTALPLQRGQTALNRTQIREILAARQVWDRIGVTFRTLINASLQSDGRLFRLTSQQQRELRNALSHARTRSGLNRRMQNLFYNTFTW